MTKTEKFRRILGNLQEQTLREEAKERGALDDRAVNICGSDVKIIEDYPLVICPVCGEEASTTEAQLDFENSKWIFFEGLCHSCRTAFRIGKVSMRCDLCHEPFCSDPYYDINEYNHHYCEKNGLVYCTPCFMQLFFDGHIDLSSDSLGIAERVGSDESRLLSGPNYTHIGYSLDPYRSRITAKGYEQVATVKEWDDVEPVCQQVAKDGGRYLVLGVYSRESDRGYNFLIYRSKILNHNAFAEKGGE